VSRSEEAVDRTIGLMCVTFDARDPERLADFWQQLLGLTERSSVGPFVFLKDATGMQFGFQRTSDDDHRKNHLHLDIAAADLPAAARTALERGAVKADGYDDGGFLVLLDPEGNEFCLGPKGSWNVDSRGRAHYLDRA
jgi:predicted enzyme related to lactoylglutathione lyase